MLEVSWLAVVTALASVPPAFLAGLVWREREEPGARPYAAMLAVMVVFVLTYALTLIVDHRSLHEFLYPSAAWLKLLVTVPWLVFALEYTGRGRYVTRRLVASLLAIPVASGVVLLTPYREGLFVQNYVLGVRHGAVTSTFQNGPLWLLLAFFGFALLGIGLAMLLEFVVTDRGRYGLQTGVLAIGGMIPGVTTVVHIAEIGPLPGIDLTPFAYALVAPLVAYGLIRWDLFGFSPATRRIGQAAAIEDFGDAVFIVGEDRRIVDLNAQAADLLGRRPEEFVHASVADVFDADVDLDAADQTLRLDTSYGRRDFTLSVSSIDGPRGGPIGHTLVLHDVTDEKQRRQRFEVLNRILRHNLRNSMNAVVGYSRQLEEHVDGSGEWMIDRIEAQSAQLVTLSEKARDIDRVTNPSQPRSGVAVAPSLQRVSDRLVEDHDDASVTVHAAEGLSLTTNEIVFEEVVRYAANSLVSYNGAETPKIVLSAAPSDGDWPWITVTITSNGDPIPADEREVIERGEETPLDHSHDLDLWLVSWGVETLGGDLTFIDDDDRPGLSLTIPDFAETRENGHTYGDA